MTYIDDDRDYMDSWDEEEELTKEEKEDLIEYLNYLSKKEFLEDTVRYSVYDPNASWNLPK